MEVLVSQLEPEAERHFPVRLAALAAIALTAELAMQTPAAPTPTVETQISVCQVPGNLAQEFGKKPDYATTVANYRDDTYATTPTQFHAIGVRYATLSDTWYHDTYKTRPLPISDAFADSQFAKYQAQEQQVAPEVLQSIGIEVDASKFPESNLTNLLLFTTMPKSILAAAGLKKIVLEPMPENRDLYQFYEPKHEDDTLYTTNDPYDINNGIAAMILDNTCSPAERQALYGRLTDITHQAGKHYGYIGLDLNSAKQDDFETFWKDGNYGDVMAANFTFNTARGELVTLIADAMNGESFYDDLQKKTPLAEKRRIAQAIIDYIDPKLKTQGEYRNYNGVWRSFNQHPFDAANYLVEMNNADAAATTDPKSAALVARNQDESFTPETAGDWPEDNTYGNDNAVPQVYKNYTPPQPPRMGLPDFLKVQY
jgi:hypothetical protein